MEIVKQEVGEEVNEMYGTTVNKIADKMGEMKDKMSTEVKDELAKSYRDILESEAKKVPTSISVGGANSEIRRDDEGKELLKEATRQVQGRLDRKNNIVLHGIPEEVKEGFNLAIRSEKIKHDKQIFIELCTELGLTCYDSDIEEIRRIGRYNDETGQGKPRLTLVSLRGSLKDRIMRNLFKLKDTGKELFRNIGVSHDMNTEERKREKELRAEAKRKNTEEDALGNYYVIRGMPWNRYILKVKRRERVIRTQEV